MEETQKNHEGKFIVVVCAYCQKINDENMRAFAQGIDQKVKDEMKVVNAQIQKPESKEYHSFSHGICKDHAIQNIKTIPGMTPERIQSFIDKINQSPTSAPCLLKDEALRHAYMKGLFTKEEIQQAQQSTQQSNERLTERFKKLAGIKD
jgi:cell division protein ZapA (FtsZ GTPase activity inhibitor)